MDKELRELFSRDNMMGDYAHAGLGIGLGLAFGPMVGLLLASLSLGLALGIAMGLILEVVFEMRDQRTKSGGLVTRH